MNTLLTILDWILFVPLSLCVAYLLFYAVASCFYRASRYPKAKKNRRFAVLFPAYKEDRVIVNSVRIFLEQDYPKELFDLIVISDQMQPETNQELEQLPIHLLKANYTDSSKAKALNLAMDAVGQEEYDIIAIMDADNTTTPNFLVEINRAFEAGLQAVQAHRIGKSLGTDIAILDSVSEEINNGIFRSGHNAVKLSASLAGSGMAFDANWFRQNVTQLETAGEDKELEVLLLKARIHTTYLQQLLVYDEKTQKASAIKNQRKRWIAVQFSALCKALPNFSKAIMQGNPDYCDKILQWMLPPRLVQLGGVFLLTLLVAMIDPTVAGIKWYILSTAQIAAMLLPIPRNLVNQKLFKALLKLPLLIIIMAANMFKLKGASRKFIHTEHGNH